MTKGMDLSCQHYKAPPHSTPTLSGPPFCDVGALLNAGMMFFIPSFNFGLF